MKQSPLISPRLPPNRVAAKVPAITVRSISDFLSFLQQLKFAAPYSREFCQFSGITHITLILQENYLTHWNSA
jgi:hypothetical protein